MAEITAQEMALILEALDDGAYYRDSRARVLKSAVRRRGRSSSPTPRPVTTDAEGDASDIDRRKAKAYEALAIKLRGMNTADS